MTLSSLSLAAGTGHPSPSRSPFQVDRDRAGQAKGTQAAAPVASLPAAGRPAGESPAVTGSSAGSPAVTSSAAYNPWLTLTLQEHHLLSQDISAWAQTQGLRPLWNSNRDYLIYSTINLSGKSRDEVLSQLGQLFRSENYGLVVKLYEKNNVLVIDGQ
ncbi:pilus assembly protein [Salmonella enterica subsp. enterica serovar Kottbus]|nr:pilus assembly protein [Salmonella enterica subsp. enterica serovar Kottbus]EHN5888486.1 TcpQ domain-containing protein [Salmonella enterica subsp. enterica serovar Newport]